MGNPVAQHGKALDGFKVCAPFRPYLASHAYLARRRWAADAANPGQRRLQGHGRADRRVRVPYPHAPTRRVGRTQGALTLPRGDGIATRACGAGGYQPPGDGPHHPRAGADLSVAAHHGAHVRRVTAALPPARTGGATLWVALVLPGAGHDRTLLSITHGAPGGDLRSGCRWRDWG